MKQQGKQRDPADTRETTLEARLSGGRISILFVLGHISCALTYQAPLPMSMRLQKLSQTFVAISRFATIDL